MGYKLVITPRASTDIVDACMYYEAARPGLSTRFLSELLIAYSNLKNNPLLYSFVSSKRKSTLRDIKIRNFPYLVIFDIVDDVVTVYAVFNTHRKPKAI